MHRNYTQNRDLPERQENPIFIVEQVRFAEEKLPKKNIEFWIEETVQRSLNKEDVAPSLPEGQAEVFILEDFFLKNF